MALIKPSEPWAMTAEDAAQRRGYASKSELELRNRLEEFCRGRWPDARIVHEIVMGEGRTRADVAAISPAHIAAFEVKGAYDETTRLMHQVGMFQLCVPEVWIVAAENHYDDAKLIRHLLPSVGILIGAGMGSDFGSKKGEPVTLRVEAEAAPRAAVPEMMLRMLWAAEIRDACAKLKVAYGAKTTREHCVRAIMSTVEPHEIIGAVCTQLRARDAVWRADPPVALPARDVPEPHPTLPGAQL